MEDSAGDTLPAGRGEEAERHEKRLTADGSATLFSRRFGQTFHSHHGAVAESRHVFLESSGAAARLRRGESVRLLEVGFGTGLNFALTAQEARAGGAELEYVALELTLLSTEVLASLDYGRDAPGSFEALLEFRMGLADEPQPGAYRAGVAGCVLELRLGEASAARIEPASYDLVYHDGFSPDANPELWEEDFLQRLAASLRPGGALVTYTVKGLVRRRLAAAGLEVRKLPGPRGGKREMLLALRGEEGREGRE